MKKNTLIVGLALLVLTSCEKWLEPDLENLKSWDEMYEDPRYAQGFLTNAYGAIPAYYNNSDVATDDAVANVLNNNLVQIATGSWMASSGAFSVWNQAYGSLQYINLFLVNSTKVKWTLDPETSGLFNLRLRGEAFGLRALFMYHLLRNHAGFTVDERLMGVPLTTEYKTTTDDHNLPRATFEECMQFIYNDLDSAIAYLPMDYNDLTSNSQIPTKYQSIVTNYGNYNFVMGMHSRQLFTSVIAQAFKARAALLAASPAFQHPSNSTTWEMAANSAADVIRYKNLNGGLPSNGHTFYANRGEIDGLAQGINPPEIIWRENMQTNNSDQEAQNFPPSLNGSGFINPSQNLVDAFPMANGYPIGHPSSTFSETNPYSNRDPRLTHYVIYNGAPAGITNTPIQTGSSSLTVDGLNKVLNFSTRTGYYLKKRLSMDVNRNPNAISGKNRYNPRIRYTEIYLIYAEAANEAWGPTGTGTNTFSAYDIIKSIRTRAGVGTNNNDPYLEECKADKDKMRELIRNERRLELCFESFRFWDLRRWKANLNETVNGMDFSSGVYTPITVESRLYENYMYYGPIPLSETLKFSNLEQNANWR